MDDNDLSNFTEFGDRPREEWKKTKRDRGFLTQADRKFLYGSRELEGQQERNARYRIRQRTIQGLQDLAFVNKHMTRFEEDIEQIANDERIQEKTLKHGALGYIYWMLVYDKTIGSPTDELERILEQEIWRIHPAQESQPEGGLFNERKVTVKIEVNDERVTVEDMPPRIESGEASLFEIQQYVDVVDPEDMDDSTREALWNLIDEVETDLEDRE